MTYRHPQMITELAKAISCKYYLELGIYTGETFYLVSSVVPHCVGVDISPKINDARIIASSTDDFFESNIKMFDMIFIDADHNYLQVKKDFYNAINCLNKKGLIVLHDTDPVDKKYLDPGFCGDSYKMVDDIRNDSQFDILTLPIAEAGLSIVSRKNSRRVLSFV